MYIEILRVVSGILRFNSVIVQRIVKLKFGRMMQINARESGFKQKLWALGVALNNI